MAGDWMKIELELPDKPEVHAIAATLNIDPDAVVGKLIRVWQWFDKHTTDGNALGVTFSLPDRISGVTGFGEAMMFVGWLEQKDKTLMMPHFDRHTSASAKQRALTAKRVAKSKVKTNAEGNGDSVTNPVSDALPREEKRREEKKERVTRATRIPEDWSVTAELGNWALEQNPEWSNEDVLRIGVKFKNHWLSKSGKDARKIDWKATWQNWILNEIDYAKKRQA